MTWLDCAFVLTAATFGCMAGAALWHVRWMRRLSQLDIARSHTRSASEPKPRCSIVIAVRNEEERIEQTIRRLLRQEQVELEIIIVDDRSTDRTPDILRALARDEPRLRVRRVDVLPEGWLGKCHACHLGAQLATSDWLLFSDGDSWATPDLILRAIKAADREDADHVTLGFGLATATLGLKAFYLLFLLSASNWFSGVNRDRPKSFLGIGAFNLVRASAYRESGGHEALRLTILDDVKLGLILRRAGKRTRAYVAGPDLECQWGTTAFSVIKLMEKNYFAAIEYLTPVAFAVATFVILLLAIAVTGLFHGSVRGLLAAISPFFLSIPAAVLAPRANVTRAAAFCAPLALPIFVSALLNSTIVTLRNGGVRWRETFYPLDQLRAHEVKAFTFRRK